MARLCHDFQLAVWLSVAHRLFRIAAYEDSASAQHKRSYAPDAPDTKERQILSRKSLVASIWLATRQES